MAIPNNTRTTPTTIKIIFPKVTAITVNITDITQIISFADHGTFIFLIPYDIPIPRESILRETESKIKAKAFITPS